VVLQDTYQNADYFHDTFHISKDKFRRLLIGAEDDIFYPRPIEKPDDDIFRVLFYGTYIPLHGIQHIIHAAKILEKENIHFQLIGKGQTFPEIQTLSKNLNLSNVEFIGMVDYLKLPEYISQSDVCLGIFGGTEKSMRVIPTKAYQILAMRKPLITGDSPGARELLKNRKNALLCEMADPKSLASAIMELKDDEQLRNNLATKGYQLFQENLTPEKIGREAIAIMKEVL
jgi:glycosyltransferase involved in cell wall biosynthesis